MKSLSEPSKWDFPPPLCILSGNENGLIQRELSIASARAISRGRRVVRSSSTTTMESVFMENIWNSSPVLIIHEGKDFDASSLISHHEKGDSTIGVILVLEKVPKSLSKLPKALIGTFESPKSWEREDFAVKFLEREAKEYDIVIPEALAKVLVKTLGDEDLGLLSFQVWKLGMLLESSDSRIVTLSHIRDTLVPGGGLGLFGLMRFLFQKNVGESVFQLRLMKNSVGVVFPVVSLIVKNLRTLLVAKSMAGKDPEEIALVLGMKSSLVKMNVLPLSARWEVKDLKRFLRDVLEVRSAAKWGSLDPWLHLEAVILQNLGV